MPIPLDIPPPSPVESLAPLFVVILLAVVAVVAAIFLVRFLRGRR